MERSPPTIGTIIPHLCQCFLSLSKSSLRSPGVISDFQEPVRKQVGGRLSSRSTLDRLESLRKNAAFLRGKPTPLPYDDGSLVRKVVGAPRPS